MTNTDLVTSQIRLYHFLLFRPTTSLEWRPFWETNGHSSSEEMPRLLGNSKIHCLCKTFGH